jgi:Rod binding domain-containing protein
MLYVNPIATPFTPGGSPDERLAARAATAVQEFERYFIFSLLREMGNTVPDGGMFGSGFVKDMQMELFYDAVAGEVAKSGQLALPELSRQVQEQLEAARLQDRLLSGM